MAGPIIELLNYCTAVKFESFEAAESKCLSVCLSVCSVSVSVSSVCMCVMCLSVCV